MGAEDEQRIKEIRNVRLHRLRLLELQQANLGISAPPELLIEIESTKRELGFVDAVIASPLEPTFADALGAAGQFTVIVHVIDQLGKMLGERIDRVEEHGEERAIAIDAARAAGQNRTRLVLFAVLVMIFALAILVFERG